MNFITSEKISPIALGSYFINKVVGNQTLAVITAIYSNLQI